jgi:BirA family biotin operon repressor/biotin-[acetyl-CoA-carboxylase] ligase
MTDGRAPLGHRLVCLDIVGSTNDEAKRLACAGAEDGTVVWALEQTAGRGRRGRSWSSPRGNLYASLILRPECPVSRAAQLGFVAAVAVGSALTTMIGALGELRYKWPNDIMIRGRKLAGILLESEMGEAEALRFLVIGIGVNLVSSPPDPEFAATSLAEEGLAVLAPAALIEELSRQFNFWVTRWRGNGFAPVRAAWRDRAYALGGPIRVRLDNAVFCGRFVDIDEEGTLLLEAAGERRRILAGEVFPTAPSWSRQLARL